MSGPVAYPPLASGDRKRVDFIDYTCMGQAMVICLMPTFSASARRFCSIDRESRGRRRKGVGRQGDKDRHRNERERERQTDRQTDLSLIHISEPTRPP